MSLFIFGKRMEAIFLIYSSKILGGAEKPNKFTFEYDDGMKVTIEPNEKLVAVLKEVMGFNIFDEEERMQNYVGLERTSNPVLEPGKEGKYTFDFVLGATEENPEIRLAPSREQLDELERNSKEATLVIHIEDKEMARFDLTRSN